MAADMVCVHHWVIEPPSGPLSDGRCRKCGAGRVFQNSDQRDSGTNWKDEGFIAAHDRQTLRMAKERLSHRTTTGGMWSDNWGERYG